MAKTLTPIRMNLKPSQIKALNFSEMKTKPNDQDLSKLGISMDSSIKGDLSRILSNDSYAMDSTPLQTTPTISNAVQFFQYWAPEAVEIITSARKIDEVVGRTMAGSFEDEEIVTRVLERTGSAQPYTDTANIPFASWNMSFETRDIVRFEEGLQVGYLEAMRSSRMNVDSHREKARAVADSLDIERNRIGFYGYANGLNKTYGLLNDLNLLPYQTVAQGASGNTTWVSKTFNEIVSDILTAVNTLVTNLKGNFDPTRDAFKMTVALSAVQYLNKMNDLGTQSVMQWIRNTYPKMEIVAVPEFDNANGNSNVFYMSIDRTQGADVACQYVQELLRLIGVEKKAKVTLESYANATAGVIIQQPLGVVRYSGI